MDDDFHGDALVMPFFCCHFATINLLNTGVFLKSDIHVFFCVRFWGDLNAEEDALNHGFQILKLLWDLASV